MTEMPAANIHGLLAVYAVYVIAVASPGPSNMTIMAVAMSQGRRAALAVSAGVLTGSLIWAGLAAAGVSTLLAAYAEALFALKIAGGIYLLWLAFKAARSAVRREPAPDAPEANGTDLLALYRRGLMLHLSNPKAILAWVAIMSLGVTPDAPAMTPAAIMAGCFVLGVAVFGGYALAFSTAPMVRAYRAARRGIEATLAVFFMVAGLRLLLSRV